MGAESPITSDFMVAVFPLLVGGILVAGGIFGSRLKAETRQRIERYFLKPLMTTIWAVAVMIELWRHEWLAAGGFIVAGSIHFSWLWFERRKKRERQVSSDKLMRIGSPR